MAFPSFFSEIQPLVVHDRLAEFLGAADGGVIEYRYADAVKLAGHSCPTVAGTWLLTCRALAALYPDELPERGGIEVAFREALDSGVAGVMASVIGLITGAAGTGGFKGIGGQFVRRNLQAFGAQQPLALRFTRSDSGATVDAAAELSRVPPHPEMPELMRHCMRGEADAAQARRFGELWQQRVARILLEHWDDPEVFHLSPVG